MRFLPNLLVSATALVQDASPGAWYTQPVWIAIGVIALVLIVVLISMARRRNNTTGVK